MLFFLSKLPCFCLGHFFKPVTWKVRRLLQHPPLQQIQKVGVKATEAAVLTLSLVKDFQLLFGKRWEDNVCISHPHQHGIQGIQKHSLNCSFVLESMSGVKGVLYICILPRHPLQLNKVILLNYCSQAHSPHLSEDNPPATWACFPCIGSVGYTNQALLLLPINLIDIEYLHVVRFCLRLLYRSMTET